MRFRRTWSALRALGLGACTSTNLRDSGATLAKSWGAERSRARGLCRKGHKRCSAIGRSGFPSHQTIEKGTFRARNNVPPH